MIDWSQIQQLEEDIGAEDFGDVVVLFIEEVDEAVAQLQTIAPTDLAQLAPALHFLKGSAYNLGFKSFGDYCSNGEIQAMDGGGTDIDITKVAALYETSKALFFKEASNHCSFKA